MKTDEKLLVQIKEGNVSALESFFQNSHARLISYANLFITNEAVAADIVQESFISFWNKRKELKVGKSIEALIFVSVRNRCLNHLRDTNTYKEHLENIRSTGSDLQYLTHFDFIGEEEESIEEKIMKDLNLSIEKLPQKCKQVFVMSKLDGMKQSDIATELNISKKAVEKHIATAKKKLRESLELKYPMLSILTTFFIDF